MLSDSFDFFPIDTGNKPLDWPVYEGVSCGPNGRVPPVFLSPLRMNVTLPLEARNLANPAEQSTHPRARSHTTRADERAQLLAMFDAVQVALACGQRDRVSILLKGMRSIVVPALTRRRRVGLRTSA